MPIFFYITLLFILLLPGRILAAESLNIFGLTTDMTLAQIYEKMEPYSQSIGFKPKTIGFSSKMKPADEGKWFAGNNTEKYYIYLISQDKEKKDDIWAAIDSQNLDDKPFRITRYIGGGYYENPYSVAKETFLEKFGEANYDSAKESLSPARGAIWLESRDGDRRCQTQKRDYKTMLSAENDAIGCDSVLKLASSSRNGGSGVSITLENAKAIHDRITELNAAQEKPKF